MVAVGGGNCFELLNLMPWGLRACARGRALRALVLSCSSGYLPDVVVGSPPCQEISAANTKAKGITDDHLFWEWVRIVFRGFSGLTRSRHEI